jgi:hypothetical protein
MMAASSADAADTAADAVLIDDPHLRSRPATFTDAAEESVFNAMEGLPSGFGLEADGEAEEAATLYGELTTAGIRQVASFTRECAAALPPDAAARGVVFWDLGSGTGRVAMETLLVLRSGAAADASLIDAVGVEYCAGRHEVAVKAAGRLAEASAAYKARPAVLVQGDFFKVGATPIVDHGGERGPYVAAFCCGVGFSEAQCDAICSRLEGLGPRLLCATLLFKRPNMEHRLLSGRDGGALHGRPGHVEATWMDAAPAVFVTRR